MPMFAPKLSTTTTLGNTHKDNRRRKYPCQFQTVSELLRDAGLQIHRKAEEDPESNELESIETNISDQVDVYSNFVSKNPDVLDVIEPEMLALVMEAISPADREDAMITPEDVAFSRDLTKAELEMADSLDQSMAGEVDMIMQHEDVDNVIGDIEEVLNGSEFREVDFHQRVVQRQFPHVFHLMEHIVAMCKQVNRDEHVTVNDVIKALLLPCLDKCSMVFDLQISKIVQPSTEAQPRSDVLIKCNDLVKDIKEFHVLAGIRDAVSGSKPNNIRNTLSSSHHVQSAQASQRVGNWLTALEQMAKNTDEQFRRADILVKTVKETHERLGATVSSRDSNRQV